MKSICIVMLAVIAMFVAHPNLTAQKSKSAKVEVKVMYFHGPMRCQGCIQIENDTKATMENIFKNDMKSGKVSLSIINFVDDSTGKWEKMYNLETQTLIVAKYIDGKQVEWKNLEKIWTYSGNYPKFSKYVSDEVKSYLK